MLVLSLLTCWGSPLAAAEPAALVDAKLTTAGNIWQGQRVIISLTIKTPDTFASAVAFDLPQISGLILVPPTGRPIVGTETVGEDSYTTQLHEMSVIPQQAGQVKVVSFPIRFDSAAGFGQPVKSRVVSTPELSFAVKRPPGTGSRQLVLTTANLNVAEAWKPQPGEAPVAVGASFTRTIKVSADNLPAIVLPSFRIQPPAGLRVYNREPELEDQENRGDLVGQKTETATFVCEHPGRYELPAMSVSWWNPTEQKLNEVTLPAHSFSVSAPPPSAAPNQADAAPTSTVQTRRNVLALAVAIVVAMGAAWYLGPAIRQHWATLRRMVADSEQQAFRVVVRACYANDAHAAYRAILAWRDKLNSASTAAPQNLADAWQGDSRLVAAFETLESSLYGAATTPTAAPWSSPDLLTALKRFRNQQAGRRRTFFSARILPAMNPSSAVDSQP